MRRSLLAKNLLHRLVSIIGLVSLVTGSFAASATPAMALQDPASVTIAGDLQSELGCPGDWQPECVTTQLAYDAADDLWQGTFTVPAGTWQYKAALNGTWDVSYPGDNLQFTTAAAEPVKFYYDHKSHWVTNNKMAVISTAAGNFQDELGCPGDWSPDCLRSLLQDPDGDGTYIYQTSALPAGAYEGKVAINEAWDENYGQGGAPNGANIPFTVTDNSTTIFNYNATTHVLNITSDSGLPAPDNNVEWDGLRHDSRDTLYRTPGGAVPAGTPVKLRFRTLHNDVTKVQLRVYDLNQNGQVIYPMVRVAVDVSCYESPLEQSSCDFWEVTLANAEPNNLWYRFIVTDGTDTDYYDDNTAALDGGLGAPTEDAEDHSWALMVHDPAFKVPSWATNAVIYQIFPDRFRDGNSRNNPRDGDIRYDDPVIALPWGTLPEGYCRNYADGSTNCPWRFDDTPPDWSPTKEGPRGRDYFGGDLKGVTEKLPYLKSLGVTVIYFNPIFEAESNHRYDTADFTKIDHNLGTNVEFQNLVRKANQVGIRIVLDGVFNHMSSDSPIFDRYGHYPTVGACESADSQWRGWFTFRLPNGIEAAPCAPSTPGGPNTAYDGWFGFDSIPVITKSNPSVQEYFLTNADSIARMWLQRGASGWRMDVMGDASFPEGYWETFRDVVKETRADSLIIGELWQKDSTLLRYLRGDRADTTMNYRLRDAVIGFLAPQPFDSKGFADSGRQISPSEFAARIESIREDYPDAAYYSLMNLLDSHDTERLLWTLTPGEETREEKELNAANLAEGKVRMQLASLIQYTMPGSPTVYYGDEVGVTGDDDPDDRRTYPWRDRSGVTDDVLLKHYQTLALVRKSSNALVRGDIKMLLSDDGALTVAYGRKYHNEAAVVVINGNETAQTVDIPVASYLPNGTALLGVYGVGNNPGALAVVKDGALTVNLSPHSGLVLITKYFDLTPPAAPTGLTVTNEGAGEVGLSWSAVRGAAGYNVYRSVVSGGGWVKVNDAPLTTTTFTDTGLRNAQTYYYIVRAVDAKGNESAPSNEVDAKPSLVISWANLQWPPTMTHTVSATDRTDTAYGQVYIEGQTNQPGPTPALMAQLGFGPEGTDPAGSEWMWVDASFNTDAGNNDEFMASMLPTAAGNYDYVYRYSTTGGDSWLYADLSGPVASGVLPTNPGKLTVNAPTDVIPPSIPANLAVTEASPTGISLSWDASTDETELSGYEVARSDTAGGPYTVIATVTSTTYTDTTVLENATYYYVVRAVDAAFNRSDYSNEVNATAAPRTVTLTFNVTVPDTAGRTVYIAGSLDRLDGGHPSWNPGGVALTQSGPNTWTITFTGKESTQIEYKYTLGSWDFVEKDGACGEIGNRLLTLSYGTDGNQVVNDTVLNWRNVSPCGN